MFEKHNMVQRNMTGALVLGAVAGILTALPDVITSLFMPEISLQTWLGLLLLFFFSGMITGGLLGLVRSLFHWVAERFSEDYTQARMWKLWGRRALAAAWASAVFPSLPWGLIDQLLFTLVFAFLAAVLLPAAYNFCFQSTQQRDRLPRFFGCIGLLLLAGVMSTTSAWGAPRWFEAPGFWFITGFLLHIGILFFSATAIRIHFRRRKRIFSPIMTSPLIAMALIMASLGSLMAKRMLTKDGVVSLRNVSLLAYGLIQKHEKPIPAKPTQDPHIHEHSLSIQTVAPYHFSLPWNQTRPIHSWRIETGRSLLIVTTQGGDNPSWPSGACYTGGWRVGGGLEMDLGSFFTGHHLPLWARLAPERPAPGPVWPWLFSRIKMDVVRYGSLKFQSSEYFREIPDFGFPESFDKEGVQPVHAFLRTRDLVNPPFFVWVHQTHSTKQDSDAVYQASQTDNFVVLWLILRENETVDACIFDPQNPRPWTQTTSTFSLAGILPSLMPIVGHRTEFWGVGFPNVYHPRVRVRHQILEEARPLDARKLQTRIRKQIHESFPRELSTWVNFLDSRICRGHMTSTEIRRLFSRVQTIQNRPEIARRLDLLRWRMGFPNYPPLWVIQRAWSLRFPKITALLGPPPDVEPIINAWIAVLQGHPSEQIQKYCPGYPYIHDRQSTSEQEKGN